jgi:hypothetical protein
MQLVYVDESGSPSSSRSDPNYPLFVMAACIFDSEGYCQRLMPAVCALKIRHLGSDSTVLHEAEIRKRIGLFGFRGDAPAQLAFLEELSGVIRAHVPQVVAAVIRSNECGEDFESVAIKALWRGAGQHLLGPSRWIFEERGKREDAAVSRAFVSLSPPLASHEFVSKRRGLAGLEMADMLARPIGLSVLRPNQPNRALDGMRARTTIVVV